MGTLSAAEEPFPATCRRATGLVSGMVTEASCTNFADKILITISQAGRLAQWIQVPLSAPSPAFTDPTFQSLPPTHHHSSMSALPALHLTPRTLFGGGGEERETLGQLYAAQIASHLSLRNPGDGRTMVLGLGLGMVGDGKGVEEDEVRAREAMFDVLELVLKVV